MKHKEKEAIETYFSVLVEDFLRELVEDRFSVLEKKFNRLEQAHLYDHGTLKNRIRELELQLAAWLDREMVETGIE